MIAESTRPATVRDLETLDDRRFRVAWAGGTPWGCLLWAPLAVTAAVALLAVPVSMISRGWSTVGVAAAAAAGASFFTALCVVGGEWARLRLLASRRPARAAAHPPLRVLRASAARAWLVADVAAAEWSAFVVFDAGDGEVLCIHAATALRAAGGPAEEVPGTIPGGVEVALEPGVDWPLEVALSGPEVPLRDLMGAEPPVVLLGLPVPRTHPLRLRAEDLSAPMRELVLAGPAAGGP